MLLLVGIATVAAACGRAPALIPPAEASAPPPVEQASGTGSIAASFRHVNLHVDDGIVLEVRRLDGVLVSDRPGVIPSSDDPRSYTVRVDSAEVAISPRSLSNLMNQRVFAYAGAPLKDIEVSIEGGHLKQTGKARKGVDVPFSLIAEVSVTSDGRIRLHPISMKVMGVQTAGLMKLLGIGPGGFIKLKESSGMEIEGDDFLMSPDRMLPLPKFAGRLTGVRVERDRLVEVFGPPPSATAPVTPARSGFSFLSFKGGTMRFGRLTMSDTDLEIVGEAPERALEFSVPHHRGQLVAGYAKSKTNGGLVMHVPDYTASGVTTSRVTAPPHRP
jgi:hypothetical protein